MSTKKHITQVVMNKFAFHWVKFDFVCKHNSDKSFAVVIRSLDVSLQKPFLGFMATSAPSTNFLLDWSLDWLDRSKILMCFFFSHFFITLVIGFGYCHSGKPIHCPSSVFRLAEAWDPLQHIFIPTCNILTICHIATRWEWERVGMNL